MYRLLPVSVPYLLDPVTVRVLATIVERGRCHIGQFRSRMIMFPSLGHTEIARKNGYVLACSWSIRTFGSAHPDNSSDSRPYRSQTKGEAGNEADALVIAPCCSSFIGRLRFLDFVLLVEHRRVGKGLFFGWGGEAIREIGMCHCPMNFLLDRNEDSVLEGDLRAVAIRKCGNTRAT